MYRDSSGRIVQLADASGDTWKADLTRTYAMVSCACPPPGPSPQQQPPPSLSHRELFRMILQNIRCANCPSVLLVLEYVECAVATYVHGDVHGKVFSAVQMCSA